MADKDVVIRINTKTVLWTLGGLAGAGLFCWLFLAGVGKWQADYERDVTERAEASMASYSASQLAAAQHWVYKDVQDELRGTSTPIAKLVSKTPVSVTADGKPSYVTLYVRKTTHPEEHYHSLKLYDVYFATDGQFNCSVAGETRLALKFDDKKVQEPLCDNGDSGDASTMFVNFPLFETEYLGKTNRLLAELPFYAGGRQQVEFDISGFDPKKVPRE